MIQAVSPSDMGIKRIITDPDLVIKELNETLQFLSKGKKSYFVMVYLTCNEEARLKVIEAFKKQGWDRVEFEREIDIPTGKTTKMSLNLGVD